jgi:flagellar basal-body rod protein FlgB
MSLIDGAMWGSLQAALTAGQLRQQVYANNIANANTPGFKRQSVIFEPYLQASLAASGIGSSSQLPMLTNNNADLSTNSTITNVQPQVVTDTSTSTSANGNNVNTDSEMSLLAENQIQYSAVVQEINNQFTLLKTAITG